MTSAVDAPLNLKYTYIHTYIHTYCTYIHACMQSVSNWWICYLKRYFSETIWDRNTICVVFYSLTFLTSVHVTNVHLLPQYTPDNDVEQSDISSGLLLTEYHSLMACSKFDEHWISRYQSRENIASMTYLGIVQKSAWLHQPSLYQWNFSFFWTEFSTHLAPFHRLQRRWRIEFVTPPTRVTITRIRDKFELPKRRNHLRSYNDNFSTCLCKHMMNVLYFSSEFWITHNKIVFLSHFVAEK